MGLVDDPRPTALQLQMICMCAAGKTREEIGRELILSPHTVKTYLDRLREMIGARNITHAVVICISRGYLHVDLEASPTSIDRLRVVDGHLAAA